MIQTPWIERTFNFDFPPGYYPVFLERMRGLFPRASSMVANVSDRDLIFKPEGKWSIKDHLGHFADIEELYEKRFDEFMAGKEILSAADMTNQKTVNARHTQSSLPELLTTLNNTRGRFIERLERVPDEMIIRTAIHPRLNKEMRLVDMIFFICEHDDHHLAKMRSILQVTANSK